jgi:uncharacterized protein (DUF2252 family)
MGIKRINGAGSAESMAPGPRPFETAEQRRARGRALRDAVPRESHGGWKAPKGRSDPIRILQASNEGRIPSLIPVRFGRMAQSAFAFYRGAAAIMAADLSMTPASGLLVQACGDAHLMNFGAFATPERHVIFDINDLDETLPAPWEWDLKRLTASLVIAAQYLQLPHSDAARIATAASSEYRERMIDYAAMRTLDVWYDRIDVSRFAEVAQESGLLPEVRKRLKARAEEARRKASPEVLYPKLVSGESGPPRIKDEPPLMFHPDAALAPGLASDYADAIEHYRKSLPEHVRCLFDRYRFVDLAMKVVGVGSVGTQCAVGLFMASDDDPLFLQVKEARASVLEPHLGASRHANHGERIVAGQHLMQSASDVFLGWTKGKGQRHFYVRQLRDMKIAAVLDDWDAPLLRAYGRVCAHALARAHARSGDAAMIAGYMGSNRIFDDAMAEFAVGYADQNQSDYRTFLQQVRDGRIQVVIES